MSKSVFLAVGHDGLRMVSTDGRKWEAPQLGKEGETYRAAAFGNGRCVAVGSYGGNNILASSADGKSWQMMSHDARYSRYVRGLVFGKGAFFAVGGDPGAVGVARPFVLRSTDGKTWTGPHDIPGKFIIRRVAFGNDRFVGVGDRGRRSASPDGLNWKDASEVRAIDTLIDVAFGNGVFVGVGLHGLRMTTTDGLNWTDRQTGEEGEHLNAVLWAKDRFVAVGAGATFTSPDGRKWERHANTNAPLTVAYGKGVFIGPRWKGRLMRSTDGVRWEEVLKADRHVEAVAFGELG
jgi:hypothetical protein